MAEGKKEVYPQIPVKWWWDLRRQFRRSLPSSITDTYLGSVLTLKSSSAKGVAIPHFKLLGIMNQDGTINDGRARAWRDDDQYPQVCQAIVKELYPQELLDAFPEPSEGDRRSIEQWFARKIGVGDKASKAMTTFYLMLSEADPSKAVEPAKPKAEKPKVKPKPELKVAIEEQEPIDTKIRGGVEKELGIPSVNINIEIHISSDTSPTQIDNIFESMAKHLNIRSKIANE